MLCHLIKMQTKESNFCSAPRKQEKKEGEKRGKKVNPTKKPLIM